MYRACYCPPENPPRTPLPASAFINYKNQFQEPKLEEGFDEIRAVNFRFEGTPEQRKKWDMYMLEAK
jgi:bifunctional polynucleotide phosphatase/kinase